MLRVINRSAKSLLKSHQTATHLSCVNRVLVPKRPQSTFRAPISLEGEPTSTPAIYNKHKWILAQKRAAKHNSNLRESMYNKYLLSFQLFEQDDEQVYVLLTVEHTLHKNRSEYGSKLESFLLSSMSRFDLKPVSVVDHEEDFEVNQIDLEEHSLNIGYGCHFVMPFHSYTAFLCALETFNENEFEGNMMLQKIPSFVHQIIERQTSRVDTVDDSKIKWHNIPEQIISNVLPYQREAIIFGIKQEGRVLLADEMGLGKTLQAIALACYYKDEWPLLIVCPSSLRMNWQNELVKWRACEAHDIHVIMKGTQLQDMPLYKVNIISYELLARSDIPIKPKVVIVDESHFVKSSMSKRTKAVRPVIKKAKRALLLSGTATPSRPIELYDQMKPLFNMKNVKFMTKTEFGARYCDLRVTAFGTDYSGSANLPELNLLLSRTIMIRRLKKHVLQDLQPKNRKLLFISRTYDDDENDLIAKEEVKRIEYSDINFDESVSELQKNILLYKQTGSVKLPMIRQYLREKIFSRDDNEKFLIFAHHQEVLDGIEEEINQLQRKSSDIIDYIRIDGNTATSDRPALAEYFCQTPACKYAVLSLTCAGTGLNFQGNCSNVIFAELFWTPGVLLQAEDRVHRIGTSTDTQVQVRYLICDNTLDDRIWPLIQKKLSVVGTTLDRHVVPSATDRQTLFSTKEQE